MAFPSIKIQIGADTTRLGRDLKKGEGLVHSFGKTAGNAMLGLAGAAAGAAIAIGVNGVKAAIEDEAAQAKLAKTLENVTNASKAQVKQVEDYIEKTTMATGVTDDELRPSLDRLIRSTQNVTKAQQLQKIALDVAAGTGKDLQSVTNAIAKAYDGNFGALKRLGVPLDDAIVKSKDFNKVQQALEKTFSGQLDASLDTQAGKLKLLNTRFQEMQEQIGFVLLEGLQPLMDWASGPEGQKFLNDFMLAFRDAAVATAKALPGILEIIKKIASSASAIGLSWETILDPRFMLASAAFKFALPLGLPAAAIAALIAYQGAGEMMKTDAQKTAFGKGIQANAMKVGGFYDDGGATYVSGLGLKYENKAQRDKTLAELARYNALAAVNVTVNGAVDPQQTAIAIQRNIAKASRMRVGNNNAPAMGF